jgi:hypothetical protein
MPQAEEVNEKVARLRDIDSFDESVVAYHDIGNIDDNKCQHCGALYFNGERIENGSYNKCCGTEQHKSRLPPITKPPLYINQLLRNNDHNSEEVARFNKKPRSFNTAVSFASIRQDEVDFRGGHGPPTMVVNGAIIHQVGFLRATNLADPKYLQCFFYNERIESSTYFDLNKLTKKIKKTHLTKIELEFREKGDNVLCAKMCWCSAVVLAPPRGGGKHACINKY